MKCPECGSNTIEKVNADTENETHYGCLDCDCWFTIHDESYKMLIEELRYEKTI